MNNDSDFFKKNEKRIDYNKQMKKSMDYKYDPIIGKASFNKSRQQFQKRINEFQQYLDQTYQKKEKEGVKMRGEKKTNQTHQITHKLITS